MAAGLLVALTAASSLALEIGEKAPELDVTGWAQGDAIKLADGAGKTVFVVEFVVTFKPECADAIASATKLQDRWKGKGLEVVLVSSESEDDVKKYLADHKTAARVALDGDHNSIAGFVGENPDLPYALVVDKTGAVVFRGNPSQGLDKVVGDVLAGRFDLKKAVEIDKLKAELWKALSRDDDSEDEETPAEDEKPAEKKDPKKDAAKVEAICDQILGLDATDEYAFDQRCEATQRRDALEDYRKFLRSQADRVKDAPKALAHLARRAIDDGKWDWRDPDLAVTAARRAVEASKSTDADVLDAWAAVLASVGLLEQAVVEEKKAAALEPKVEGYARTAAFYEACLATKRNATKK
jgi:peroxiredoxin